MLHNMPMPICACTGENKAISNLVLKNDEPTTPTYAFMGTVPAYYKLCVPMCIKLHTT